MAKDLYLYRDAKATDLGDIAQMSKVIYHGYDHLASIFLDLLKSPVWRLFVAEDTKLKEVVAHIAFLIVDSGKAITLRFGRVEASHRGQKILSHLLRYGYNQVLASGRKIAQTKSFLTVEFLRQLQARNIPCRILDFCGAYGYILNVQKTRKVFPHARKQARSIERMNIRQLLKIRETRPEIQVLFKSGMLYAEGDMFTIDDMANDEIEFLESMHYEILISSVALDNHTDDDSDGGRVNKKMDAFATTVCLKPVEMACGLKGFLMNTYGDNKQLLMDHVLEATKEMCRICENESEVGVKVAFRHNQPETIGSHALCVKEYFETLDQTLMKVTHDVMYAYAEGPVDSMLPAYTL